MKSKKKSIKAAIYIRVSTVEQSDNNFSSLDGQLNQCKTWINQRNTIQSADGKKIEVHGIYKDTKSGKDLNRPGIERLMKDAKSGQFDLLVVTKIDRVSRSLKDFLNFFEKLESCNIDIASVTQEIDTSTSAGKALQRMLLVFAEFERDMVSERTREKRIETLKAGRWQGGTPRLGYDIEEKELKINTEEAETVKKIFKEYLKLKSSNKVADYLNRNGLRNKHWVTKKGTIRGGGRFNNKSVLNILSSRLYLGQYEFEGKIYDGKHKAIIDEETFARAQEVISQNSIVPHTHVKSSTPAILREICSCGLCENSMTVTSTTKRAGKKEKKYFYYKCTKKNSEGISKDHNPKDLPMGILDNFVFSTLLCLMKEPELLNAIQKRTKFEGEYQIGEIESKVSQIKGAIKARKKDETNTLKLLTDNPTSILKETYESQLETIILELEELENELQFLNEQLERLKQKRPINKSSYKKILEEFTGIYQQSDIQLKRDFIKTLVKDVESSVNSDTNDGIIKVEYISDKRLEADWAQIKSANSEVEVRTLGLAGSPGRIRTYDPSVNSRLLCR